MKIMIITTFLKLLVMIHIIKGSTFRETMSNIYAEAKINDIKETNCPTTWKTEEI